jgi:hypothetical protein
MNIILFRELVNGSIFYISKEFEKNIFDEKYRDHYSRFFKENHRTD